MLKKLAAFIAVGLSFALNLHAQQAFTPTQIVTSGGSPTTAPAGGAMINDNMAALQAQLAGQLFIAASGDTSGIIDRAHLQSALNNMFSSNRLPPGASQPYPTAKIVFGPGTFYFKTGGIIISGSSNTSTKLQGLWLQGSGRGVTSFDYNPTSSGPLFQNNRGLTVKTSDITFFGHDAGSDFWWNQEQAGLTNIQDTSFVDTDWAGTWQWFFRPTGGNNNSEWKFDRDSFTGIFTGGVYTPPAVVATITSGSSTIAATNTAEQVEIGDTGFFSAAVAPLAANTQYYVISASTSGFQVATTPGGSAVSFTASGTPNFSTATDQFLNFWFSKTKWWSQTGLGQWLVLNTGGSVKIRDSDISGHSPPSVAYVFNLLGNVHASGVMSFEVDGLRVEHSNNNSRLIQSQWNGGSIQFNNLDESSQAGFRTNTNEYASYQISNASGPIISYKNSQLMGEHLYNYAVSSFNFQNAITYDGVTLLENPWPQQSGTPANSFVQFSGSGNTGGLPVIHFRNCRNLSSWAVVGWKDNCDTDVNWDHATSGETNTKTVSCVGANSDFPIAGGKVTIRLPLNAVVTRIRYWNPTGSGAGGAYQYTFQTEEATPTVLAGGAATPMAGANASTPLAITSMYSVTTGTLPFQMTTDLARTIDVLDTLPRPSGIFTGPKCLIEYIGQNIQPANDEFFAGVDQRRAA